MSCRTENAAFPGLDNSPSIAGPWGRLLPGFDRVFRVSGFSSLAVGGTASLPFTWQQPGLVVAMLGCALGDGSDAGLASLSLQITVGDSNEAIFSNGMAGDYVPLMNIQGKSLQPAPVMRRVHMSEVWTVQFKNNSGTTAYTPEIAFHFRRSRAGFGKSETDRMARGSRRR